MSPGEALTDKLLNYMTCFKIVTENFTTNSGKLHSDNEKIA